MRHLDHVARGEHSRDFRAHVIVDDEAAGRPDVQARRGGQRRVGDLVEAHDHDVAGQLAGRRRDGAHVVVAQEGLHLGAEPQRDAALLERLVHGLGHVGVEDLAQRPRAFVDEVDLEPAVPEVAGHLHAERRGADDRDPLDAVEQLVELHRLADVLDVVEPVEVRAGDVRLLPGEAGADDQLIEAFMLVARRDDAAIEVDLGDHRLHPHVEPVGDIAVDGRQEEVLEARDLAAVHEGDAARRVGDVLELREHRDLQVRVQALGDGRRGRAGAASADDDQPVTHGFASSMEMPAGGPMSPAIRSAMVSPRCTRRQRPSSRPATAGRGSPNPVDCDCW